MFSNNMADHKVYQHIHRLNGDNYLLWRRQMEIFMNENRLRKYILGEMVRPAGLAEAAAWDDKDYEAQAFLMRGLELDQLK